MIEAKTYLIVGRDSVPIEEVTRPPPNTNYVNGSIELSIDGEPVLLESTHDLVDQLWSYLVQAAEKLAAGEDASFNHPDQDLPVSFRIYRRSDVVAILVGGRPDSEVRRATAPRWELVRTIGTFAEAAFIHLERLMPGRYGHELREARKLLGR